MSTLLVLRTCGPDLRSYNGFQWPERGPVACDDFDPAPRIGGGLHGLARGEGNGLLLDTAPAAVWLLVAVDERLVVPLVDTYGKPKSCKFPAGHVVFAGARGAATALLRQRYPDAVVCGALVRAGDGARVAVGDRGYVRVGTGGTASAGHAGLALAGADGTALVGRDGRAGVGAQGVASGGWGSQVRGGEGATLRLARRFGTSRGKSHLVQGMVGRDGLRAGVWYRLAPVTGRFVPVEQPAVTSRAQVAA